MQPQDEWLLTDGLGGFAMGARDGVPRRRYHGLCIASLAPPLRRRTILRAAMAEVVEPGGATPLWQATFAPHGTLPASLTSPTLLAVIASLALLTLRALLAVRWQWTILETAV